MALHVSWAFVFGILGNVVSFLVSLAPLPTFYQIYKKRTSEGYQSIPYVVSLFSAMLWIYYALLKKDAMLLITINTFCVFIQTFYIVVYFYYGPKKEKLVTLKLILLFNVFGFGAIFFSTFFLKNPLIRLQILGYICMGFALCVFVAPLGILRKVIKTKSVEYMPFTLSVFLTLGAVMWFFYGLLLKDMNIAVPNVLGFIFGILQMILYAIYKNYPKKMVEDPKLQLSAQQVVVDVVKLGSTTVCLEVNAVGPNPNNGEGTDEAQNNKTNNTTDASNEV
ncbi:hypothetical protein ERO13_D03G113201v2 [Gossypium hirsutum]|uniref:Bidirectional sugar transporter SWEET n=1 Tax=Gossypium hirsutum TaxID=3635 RepID=A0ABM2ZWB6_GOSHI|nr:bidirectional sugar transporter SWEET10-like [Gossypium hirsutum]XP_040946144.1 bidirectional sugar transporter SWEET10-like [Gossypium hirsutum]KAG4155431.1 hypothetical protein ERO13_D03G113200v2 [Gossypium hirsutum]KAG4155437.1 hypothetical protein ERO13_D03G113201v2 [Gossypium hirsutum]